MWKKTFRFKTFLVVSVVVFYCAALLHISRKYWAHIRDDLFPASVDPWTHGGQTVYLTLFS